MLDFHLSGDCPARLSGPGPAPEPALVLGLIRQETEFDAYAVSSAGRARADAGDAVGGQDVGARRAGLPYRPSDLLTDTDYNMQLGMIEFARPL